MLVLLGANFWRLNQPPPPDPRLIAMAVRATVFALPTATPFVREIEVTRVVEITRLVQAPTPIPTVTATLTPTVAPTATPARARPDAPAAVVPEAEPLAQAAVEVAERAAEVDVPPPQEPLPESPSGSFARSASETAPEAAIAMAIAVDSAGCPAVSDNQYTTVAVTGGGDGRPDNLHGDLNLGLRGYTPVDAASALIDKNGPVDGDPPQLAGILADGRLPGFGQGYQVYDWDWNCAGGLGCRAALLDHVEVALLTVDTALGEEIGIPHRGAQIYDGGYKALVLYAEETRLTLGYTREDSVANGYVVHIENVCVDPNLLALYRSSNAAGGVRCPHSATKTSWASSCWARFWWQCAIAGCSGIRARSWTGGSGIKGTLTVCAKGSTSVV